MGIDWIVVISVFTTCLTALIAVIVAWIAFQQYKTANAKLNLDLFEKRLAVYQQVRDAVAVVNSTGRADDRADRLLLEAASASEFLFGKDIQIYLERMWDRFIRIRAAQGSSESGDPEARRTSIETQAALCQEICQFYYEGTDVFAHYMRMDHRMRRPLRKVRRRPLPNRNLADQ